MKLAIIGTRGTPVVYSGFETFAEELATRLVKRGHEVSVYCRVFYVDKSKKEYRGVKLVFTPTIKSKNLETFIHSLFSTLHACLAGQYDIIYYLGVGSAIFSLFPRILRIKTVVNVDGLDWKREKWGVVAKIYLNFSEYLATALPNKVVTDSSYIKKYYERKFKKHSRLIPYGYYEENGNDDFALSKYKLKKGKYLIWVGRLVPDNHAEELLSAFAQVKASIKCVIVGDDFSGKEYKNRLYKIAAKDRRIVFTGFIERRRSISLVRNSLAYIETKRSGGTHPSLIEAMGVGALIVSNNHPANRQVLGASAVYYLQSSIKDLASKIEKISNFSFKNEASRLRILVRNRARKYFSWQKITDDYESFFKGLLRPRG